MQLSAIESELLKALYKAPEMSGEIVALLKEKGVTVTLDQAQAIGEKLHTHEYINYTETRAYADVMLIRKGIDFAKSCS